MLVPAVVERMKRYFSCFANGFFLALFSMIFASVHVLGVYLHDAEQLILAILGASFVLFLGHIMLLRGFTNTVWITVTFVLISLLATLSTYGPSTHRVFFTVSLVTSLLALLTINSRRYLMMCKRLVVIRKQRKKWRIR
jgi:glucan phosphoethanolaminetransferase (alkaline phosphatase superfamily)